jgi:hypothetical protein
MARQIRLQASSPVNDNLSFEELAEIGKDLLSLFSFDPSLQDEKVRTVHHQTWFSPFYFSGNRFEFEDSFKG